MTSLNEVLGDMKRRATVEARLRDAASVHDKLRLEVIECHNELSNQINRRSAINRYWRDKYQKLKDELIDYRKDTEFIKLENCSLKEDNDKLNSEVNELRSKVERLKLSLEAKKATDDDDEQSNINTNNNRSKLPIKASNNNKPGVSWYDQTQHRHAPMERSSTLLHTFASGKLDKSSILHDRTSITASVGGLSPQLAKQRSMPIPGSYNYSLIRTHHSFGPSFMVNHNESSKLLYNGQDHIKSKPH